MRLFSPAPGAQPDAAATALEAMPRPDGAWLFGKIPAHGDFIARGLSPAMQTALDDWLSAGLAAARDRYADFEERYRLAAPWHFVDVDADGAWSGGALCPSVDAVGRRFPILVAAPAEHAAEAEGVARAALELIFAALGDGWDADRLHAALERVNPDASGRATKRPVWAIEADDGTRIELPGRFPAGLVERMLELAA